MRRCLTCAGRFDEPRRICPKDGDVLIYEGRKTPDSGRILNDRYRLGNLIGQGGMGHVYEATSLDSGTVVAIKLLRPAFASRRAEKRFRVEAEAMTAVSHPGVARVVDFHREPEGLTYIVMERLYGPTFSELRRIGKFKAAERVVELMTEACEATAAAHEKGIVHRDLKPSNILLHRVERDRFQVKVLDFGVAKFLVRQEESLSSSGELLGTLAYMAPEQMFAQRMTTAADVYSLGVILFEALAGRVPFDARTPLEIVRRQATAPAPALSTFREDISEELDDLVASCLSRKPEHRPENAGELARRLCSIRVVGPLDEPPSTTRTLRLNPSRWVGAMLDERYELHEWIAAGRFGSNVYLATHLKTGAHVAVRLWGMRKGVIRDRVIEAFRNEARAMGVRHPGLIAILDLGFTDEYVYLVTDFVESISLRSLLASRGKLPSSLAVGLIRGVSDTLGALHTRGIVSGGLSPETIRVTGPPGEPEKLLISPLGLSNLKQVESLLPGREEAGLDHLRDYLAPELRAGAPPDPRSDLYSLGMVFLEMLTGRSPMEISPLPEPDAATPSTEPPFRGPTDATMLAHLDALGSKWRGFFLRAVAREPEARFPTATEFFTALQEIAGA